MKNQNIQKKKDKKKCGQLLERHLAVSSSTSTILFLIGMFYDCANDYTVYGRLVTIINDLNLNLKSLSKKKEEFMQF